MKSFKNFSQAYRQTLKECIYSPDFIVGGNKPYQEKINYSFKLTDPYNNLFKNKIRDINLNYLKEELKLYFMGKNDAISFSKASKFWNNIKTDQGLINSAYGYNLFIKKNCFGYTNFEWAIKTLKKDINTRQAVFHISTPEYNYNGNLDYPCTMYGIFHIRDNKLYLSINMRSNDVFFGIVYDIPFFLLLMQCALLELKKHYPNLKIGYYYHFANSMHIYNKNIELLKKSLNYPFRENQMPVLNKNIILNIKNYINFYRWLNN